MVCLPAILSVLSLVAQEPPHKNPPELEALRQTLQRTQALSARFEQTKHLRALHDVLVTTGRVYYRRGGELRWHTESPGESDLVLVGATASLKMPGMASAQVVDLSSDPGIGKVFETLRAVLEADLDRLTPLFELVIVKHRPLSVSLKPRTAALARVLQAIRIDFDKQFRLVDISLNEPDGDRTDITFHDHVIETAGP